MNISRGYYQEYYKAAVGCWFTSTGKIIPKVVKFEDKEEDQAELDKVEELLSKYKDKTLKIEDIHAFNISISLGEIKCLEAVMGKKKQLS